MNIASSSEPAIENQQQLEEKEYEEEEEEDTFTDQQAALPMAANNEERVTLLDHQQQKVGWSATTTTEDQNISTVLSNSSKSHHTRRRCCIILCVVVVLFLIISLCVAVAVSLVTTLSTASNSNKNLNKFSFDDMFNSSFQVRSYSAQWTNSGNLLHFSVFDGVEIYSPADNTTTVIIPPEILMQYGVSSVKLSSSERYALLVTQVEHVYRHSFLAVYYVYDISESSVWLLPLPSSIDYNKVQYATWSPAQERVAFVYGNNLCVYEISTNTSTQYTDNGEDNVIYNGVPDWVYEEEVLSTDYALWWSPNGDQIVYLTFNDSKVESFKFPFYGPLRDAYTVIQSIAYPKAGTTNPHVKASLLQLDNEGSITDLLPPPDVQYYIIYVTWANETTPMISWMTREQSNMKYCIYQQQDCSIEYLAKEMKQGHGGIQSTFFIRTTKCTDAVYDQTSEAWIEVLETPIFTDNGQFMLLIDSVAVSEDDSYLHIKQIDVNSLDSISVTTGPWEVTHVIGSATPTNNILYISTETHPWQRHIYSTIHGCLTCDQDQWDTIALGTASECHYWSGSCSSDLTYCVLYCSGPCVPFTVLVQYSNDVFSTVQYLETNSLLHESVKDMDLPTVEEVTIPPSDENSPVLYARVLMPPGARKVCTNSYPMLFYVYGGPNSQMIGQYSVMSRLFPLYLSSSLDMMVISVDGRGTGFRGDKFKHAVYRKLGILETEDQLSAAQYFQSQCYTDNGKTAIYGSSYGGYMAGMVGGSGRGLFTTAISQSPVTDWRYYDTIYTERYMGLPTEQDNLEGYEITSLLKRASNLSEIDYLLIHGTGDDNVHFQNSAQLVRVLTSLDIPFSLQFYTDQAHSLSDTRQHLYHLIEHFIEQSFN